MDNYNFTNNDLKNPESFARSILNKFDPFSDFIASMFSEECIDAIEAHITTGKLSDNIVRMIVNDLNGILKMDDFYHRASEHAPIFIHKETLNRQDADTKSMSKTNRMILEGAYPNAFGINKTERQAHVDKSLYTPSFKLGPRTSYSIQADPRHLLFVLARYKFCSKMLAGKQMVLEIGCGDAVGAPIVSQTVKNLVCVDRLEELIKGNQERLSKFKNIEFRMSDMIHNRVEDKKFDAAFSIDVLEHVNAANEKAFMENICKSLEDDAILIIGTPNITAEKFESEPGASPHINLKNHETLKQLLDTYFIHSNIFSMNDEIVHTGFYPMAHYLMGVGYSLKK